MMQSSQRMATRTRRLTIILASLWFVACTGNDQTPTAPEVPAPNLSQETVEYDFGTLRHGATATADLTIPVPSEGRWKPLVFQRSCSCARHKFVLRSPDGSERPVGAQPSDKSAVGADEKLLLRLSILTEEKEAADAATVANRGGVVLEEIDRSDGTRTRTTVPVVFHYAIDAPIQVRPSATIDIGTLALSRSYSQLIELEPDDPTTELGAVRVLQADAATQELIDAPDVEIRWVEEDAASPARRLKFRLTPHERHAGPFGVLLVVETNLETEVDGTYRLEVPITATLVEDLQVYPVDRFLFGRIDFDERAETFVQVTDHNLARDPALHVLAIRDLNGNRVDELFEAHTDRATADERTLRLVLTYLGKPPSTNAKYLRGNVSVGRTPNGPELLKIPYVAIRKR